MLLLAFVPTAALAGSWDLKLVNVSDPHVNVSTGPNTWRLSRDSREILRSVLSAAVAERPDVVVLSGDVAEGKDYGLANLEAAVEELSRVEVPWLVVPGNRDGRLTGPEATLDAYDKKHFFAAFKGHGPDGEKGYWRRDLRGKKYVLLGLDTSVEGAPEGRVGAEELAWLDAQLASLPKRRQAIIVMHHPAVVFDPIILSADKAPVLRVFALENADALRAVLEKRGNVRLVLSGHIHAPGYMRVHGIDYLGTPSINSWPCRYSVVDLSRQALRYEHKPISPPSKIAEARDNLAAPDSFWFKTFQSSTAAPGFFAGGPFAATAPIPAAKPDSRRTRP